MRDQMKQDEAERTFNLSGSNPQNKYVSLDHILFQIEQFQRSQYNRYASARGILVQVCKEMKEYLIEQNEPTPSFIDGNITEDD